MSVQMPFPPARVQEALTAPGHVATWLASRADRSAEGDLVLTFDEEYGYARRSLVVEVEADPVEWGVTDGFRALACWQWQGTLRIGGGTYLPADPGRRFTVEWRSGTEQDGLRTLFAAREAGAGGSELLLVERAAAGSDAGQYVARRQEQLWRYHLARLADLWADAGVDSPARG